MKKFTFMVFCVLIGLSAQVLGQNGPYVTVPATSDGNYTVTFPAAEPGTAYTHKLIESDSTGVETAYPVNGGQSSVVFANKASGTYSYDFETRLYFEIIDDNGQLTGGDWTYRMSGLGYSVATTVVTNTGGGGTEPEPTEYQPVAPPTLSQNTSPGTIKHSADVGIRGQFGMTIPINVPQGVNGLTPNISLSYQDLRKVQEGAQPLLIGYGWQLTGFSSIFECLESSYCYGNKKLENAGANKYQLLGNSNILFKRTVLNGNQYQFEMHAGNRIVKFGVSEETQVQIDGKRHWLPVEVVDDFDNSYQIAYQSYGDEIIPVRIDYDNVHITFDYSARANNSGSGNSAAQLHTIKNYYGENQISEYRLISGNQGSHSVLTDIQYCGFNKAGVLEQCLPPTSLEWFTPATPIDDFQTGIETITNGLGAVTAIGRITIGTEEEPWVCNAYSYFEELIASLAVSYIIDNTQLAPLAFPFIDAPAGGASYWVTQIDNSTGTGVNGTRTYGYCDYTFLSGDAFSAGVYRELRLQDGTYVYEYYIPPSGYAVNNPEGLAIRAHYSGQYGQGGVKLSEQQVFRNRVAVYSTADWYVSKSINFVLDDTGNRTGAAITENTVNWDSTNQVKNSVTSTTNTGYGLDANFNILNIEKTVTSTTTFENDITNWLVGFPTDKTIEISNIADEPGITTLTSAAQRYGNTLKPETSTQLSNEGQLAVTTYTTYDNVGNPLSVTQSGADVLSRTQTIQSYSDNRYPEYIYNALNHESTVNAYDKRFGAAETITDPNGLQLTTLHDGVGRAVEQILPNGTVITTLTEFCNGCAAVQGVVPVYKTTVTSSHPYETFKGSPDQTSYHDMLGRVIRTETEGFNPGEIIRVDTAYDDLGRVDRTSLPYVSNTTPEFVVYSYDIRGRVFHVANPDGSSTTTDYVALANGYRIDTTQNTVGTAGTKASVRREEFNSLGQLVKSYDAYGTPDQVITDYKYDRLGNNDWVRINNDNDTIVETGFDLAGNMRWIEDPNTGRVEFTYDAFGQVKTQKDARDIEIHFTYDVLGRLTERVDDYYGTEPVTNTWVYDTKKTGLLTSRQRPGFYEENSYDALTQLQQVDTDIDIDGLTKSYSSSFTYDSYGRPQTQTYPSGVVAYNRYSQRGYADGLFEGNAFGQLLSQVNTTDAFGNTTQFTLGNGLVTTSSYDAQTGRITGINTGNGAVQNLSFDWWSNGNLYQRQEFNAANATETFTYDALNRLDTAITNLPAGARTLNYSYDALGNLTSKTDSNGNNQVTGYNYSADYKPHRLNSAVVNGITHSYQYDESGSMTVDDATGTSNDRRFTYDAMGKPILISKGDIAKPTAENSFIYGPDGARFYKQTLNNRIGIVMLDSITVIWQRPTRDRTLYLYGGAFEVNFPAEGSVTAIEKTNLGSVQHIREVTLTASTGRFEYLHTDHLGSVTAVTDQAGNLVSNASFDPFGGRRANSWSGTGSAPSINFQAEHTSRGFTGHEQLDDIGLIHMNGRVYDPVVGRFISADPIVQAPTFSQSYNRYSYVWNNPLSMTDPTGYEACWECYYATMATEAAEAGDWAAHRDFVRASGNAGLAARTDFSSVPVQYAGGMLMGVLEYEWTMDYDINRGGEVSVDNSQIKNREDATNTYNHLTSLKGDREVNQSSLGLAMLGVLNQMSGLDVANFNANLFQGVFDSRRADHTEVAWSVAKNAAFVGSFFVGGAAVGAGVKVGAEALALMKTGHGLLRIGSAATRGGSASRATIVNLRLFGQSTNGAKNTKVYYQVTSEGRYNFSVYQNQGFINKLITSGEGWRSGRLIKMAQRYEWRGF